MTTAAAARVQSTTARKPKIENVTGDSFTKRAQSAAEKNKAIKPKKKMTKEAADRIKAAADKKLKPVKKKVTNNGKKPRDKKKGFPERAKIAAKKNKTLEQKKR
ncbi:hypothetical protein CXF68_16310 [Tenacibaculum sp. Bg11-29]|nr:hypothetical protein CXF68_16310 [Tenacibaculum sp. Bg11-29]